MKEYKELSLKRDASGLKDFVGSYYKKVNREDWGRTRQSLGRIMGEGFLGSALAEGFFVGTTVLGNHLFETNKILIETHPLFGALYLMGFLGTGLGLAIGTTGTALFGLGLGVTEAAVPFAIAAGGTLGIAGKHGIFRPARAVIHKLTSRQ